MSCTEIYKFDENGNAKDLADIKNAFRGAMAIWDFLESKYLPPLPKPDWMPQSTYNERGYSRTFPSFTSDDKDEGIKEIWSLWKNSDVSRVDKICLGSTFDNVVVLKENIPELIDAFNNFEGQTSLKEQASEIQKALDKGNITGIAWNQTSVCSAKWLSYENIDNSDESDYLPYNINIHKDHWNLFEELNKI